VPAYGCRHHDPDAEDEANYLAGEVLVTRKAALRVARLGLHEAEAERLGVSGKMLRWRVNASGAAIQAQRAAARYAR
jgi:hypothetical protein